MEKLKKISNKSEIFVKKIFSGVILDLRKGDVMERSINTDFYNFF